MLVFFDLVILFGQFVFKVVDDFFVVDCFSFDGLIFKLLIDEIIFQRAYFGNELDEILIVKAIFEGLVSDESGFMGTGRGIKEGIRNLGGLMMLIGSVEVRVGRMFGSVLLRRILLWRILWRLAVLGVVGVVVAHLREGKSQFLRKISQWDGGLLY